MQNDLVFISVNFCFIAQTITILESKNMSILDSMKIVELAIDKLILVNGQIGSIAKKNKKCMLLYKKILGLLIFIQSKI